MWLNGLRMVAFNTEFKKTDSSSEKHEQKRISKMLSTAIKANLIIVWEITTRLHSKKQQRNSYAERKMQKKLHDLMAFIKDLMSFVMVFCYRFLKYLWNYGFFFSLFLLCVCIVYSINLRQIVSLWYGNNTSELAYWIPIDNKFKSFRSNHSLCIPTVHLKN